MRKDNEADSKTHFKKKKLREKEERERVRGTNKKRQFDEQRARQTFKKEA